jgi:hypothetical protein
MTDFPNIAFDPRPGPFVVKLRGDRWELTRPYRVSWDGGEVEIPARFVTNGPSVPRSLQSFVTPVSDLFQCAIPHDFLYVHEPQGWTRRMADELLIACMKAWGMHWWQRQKVWVAVRAGGGHRWGDGARAQKDDMIAGLEAGGYEVSRLTVRQTGTARA